MLLYLFFTHSFFSNVGQLHIAQSHRPEGSPWQAKQGRGRGGPGLAWTALHGRVGQRESCSATAPFGFLAIGYLSLNPSSSWPGLVSSLCTLALLALLAKWGGGVKPRGLRGGLVLTQCLLASAPK